MVTLEQAKEYLESQGITIPDFVLQALVDQANSIQECLDAHYPASTALLIQLYLLALMGLGQGDKYISSQTAPSGASRSFRYRDARRHRQRADYHQHRRWQLCGRAYGYRYLTDIPKGGVLPLIMTVYWKAYDRFNRYWRTLYQRQPRRRERLPAAAFIRGHDQDRHSGRDCAGVRHHPRQ